MVRRLIILLIFIYEINSKSNDIDKQCEVCQSNGFYNSSNGYRCIVTNETVICTCPDNLSAKFNEPCRICKRDGICNGLCSEDPIISKLTNKTSYFACFCPSLNYLIGQSCPIQTTIQTTTTTTISLNTTISNNSNKNSLFVNCLLIMLVYYLIKI